jgi:LPXTG-site transpeptidase (sortase) family protein
MSALGIMMLLCLGANLTNWYLAAHRSPDSSINEQIITHSTDTPDETKPNPRDQYKVAADKPRLLSLPTIGAEGFIQQVGVDQHQAVAVPSNIYRAGWFVQSQLPGARGLSIIDGHLDGRTGGGIFEHLGKLRAGDQFTIGFGDMSTKTFIVRKVQTVPIAETAAVLFSQDPQIGNQLNLITCSGTFNKSQKQYDHRVVVVAELR